MAPVFVKRAALLGLLGLLAVAAFILSLLQGATGIAPREVVSALFGGGTGTQALIVRDIRLPRAILALLCGVALSASGTAFQAILRNPLADPYLLGVSSGAALGAVMAVVLGPAGGHPWVLPVAAFLGGLVASAAVWMLAARHGSLPSQTLILAGVVVSSFFSALVLALNVLMEARQLQSALFWIMGSFSVARAGLAVPVALAVSVGLAVTMAGASKLNLLTQGSETAASLGVEVGRERTIFFLAACLMTGAVVAACGLVGFVGLVIPHAARMLVGPDHRWLLPAAIFLGAAFILLADVVARTVLAPAELPVGVVTALLGAPFFLWLLRRQDRYWGE